MPIMQAYCDIDRWCNANTFAKRDGDLVAYLYADS